METHQQSKQPQEAANNQCLRPKKKNPNIARRKSVKRRCREMLRFKKKAAALMLKNQDNETNLQTNQSKCNAIKADNCTSYEKLPTMSTITNFPLCKIYEEHEGKLEELKIIEGSMEIINLSAEEKRKLSSIDGSVQVYAIMPEEEDMFDETPKTSNLNKPLNQETMFSSQETIFSSQDTIPLTQETISCNTESECNWTVGKAKPEEPKRPILQGIDFADFNYIFDQIIKLDTHSKIGCGIQHFKIVGCQQNGLRKTYDIRCQMCQYKVRIPCIQKSDDVMDINDSAVAATMVTGGGYAQLEQILSGLNISCMSKTTYEGCQETVIEGFELAALREMEDAGKQEKELAIARGDICPGTDIPWIPVISDGSWMKRSYKGGYYNSSSGVGAIVGYHTKKVLYIGVKNKYCAVCQTAANRNEQPREHRCFKNWASNQSSTAMESFAVMEGFKSSVKQHGLVYSILIADGDSSVYKKILDCDPYKEYSVRVRKIECSNHMLRNFGKKINEIVARGGCKQLRTVVKDSIYRLRAGIRKAAEYRFKEKLPLAEQIEKLKVDLKNVPSHVFGEHKDCERLAYFCNKHSDPNVINYVPQLKEAGIYKRVEEAMQPLFKQTESLLYGINNNAVEVFNCIIAKFIGGKRINYGLRGSYQGRVSAAVVQYNSKEVLSRLNKAMNKKPSENLKKMEERRKHALQKTIKYREKRKGSSARHEKQTCDKDYGLCAEQAEIEEIFFTPEYEKQMATFRKC